MRGSLLTTIMQNSDSSTSAWPPNIVPSLAAPPYEWTLKTQGEQDEEYLSKLGEPFYLDYLFLNC